MKSVFILLLFVTISCSQTYNRWLSWDYDYKNVIGQDIDSSDIEFYAYTTKDITSSNWTSVYIPPYSTKYDLFKESYLYEDSTWFFFMKAHQISTGKFSYNSDTVSAFFDTPIPSSLNIKAIKEETVLLNIP